jgi:hypothetical protein
MTRLFGSRDDADPGPRYDALRRNGISDAQRPGNFLKQVKDAERPKTRYDAPRRNEDYGLAVI